MARRPTFAAVALATGFGLAVASGVEAQIAPSRTLDELKA